MKLPDQSLVKQRSLRMEGGNELERHLEMESKFDSCWEVENGRVFSEAYLLGFTELPEHDSGAVRFGKPKSRQDKWSS